MISDEMVQCMYILKCDTKKNKRDVEEENVLLFYYYHTDYSQNKIRYSHASSAHIAFV